MSSVRLYDFIDGKTYLMPIGLRAETTPEEDGRHGVRPVLRTSRDGVALMQEHARLLAELAR